MSFDDQTVPTLHASALQDNGRNATLSQSVRSLEQENNQLRQCLQLMQENSELESSALISSVIAFNNKNFRKRFEELQSSQSESERYAAGIVQAANAASIVNEVSSGRTSVSQSKRTPNSSRQPSPARTHPGCVACHRTRSTSPGPSRPPTPHSILRPSSPPYDPPPPPPRHFNIDANNDVSLCSGCRMSTRGYPFAPEANSSQFDESLGARSSASMPFQADMSTQNTLDERPLTPGLEQTVVTKLPSMSNDTQEFLVTQLNASRPVSPATTTILAASPGFNGKSREVSFTDDESSGYRHLHFVDNQGLSTSNFVTTERDVTGSDSRGVLTGSATKTSPRILGEIAFQLERRILDYVFSRQRKSQPVGKGRRRFYGYTVNNILRMIEKESMRTDGSINERLEFQLKYRLQYIKLCLAPYGYDMEWHGDFAQEVINKYGLLSNAPDRATLESYGLEDANVLRSFIVRLGREGQKDIFILLESLLYMAYEDGRAIFLW